jgi:hypothetical protein
MNSRQRRAEEEGPRTRVIKERCTGRAAVRDERPYGTRPKNSGGRSSPVEERPFRAALNAFRDLRALAPGQKNAGLKAVTLIATLNPVSQVLW